MGLRAYIRDFVVFVLFYKTVWMFVNKAPPDFNFLLLALILFMITLWFMLERTGLLHG